MEVRDPVHGAIELDGEEAAMLHEPFVQRLRHVRQVGFSYLPFPGANHSRFAHAIGVMHVAGLAFDRAYRGWRFDQPDARTRFRAAVRLAALTHDLGHAPFSHCTEFAMPPVRALGIRAYRHDPGDRRASHEDYTIAILHHPRVAAAIQTRFPCEAQHVAALISSDVGVGDDFFRDGGLDHRRLLSQLISSELDADRLDYLVRDAYFTGARYGTVDVPWILSHLGCHLADGRLSLAVDHAAIYAVEDFLIARHHMFLQVYFHHTSVVYEEMLRRHVHENPGSWSIPADLDAYRFLDDVSLEAHLRGSQDRWARRIVEYRPFKRVVERHGAGRLASVEQEAAQLQRAGIVTIVTESSSQLSRYGKRGSPPIFVREQLPGQARPRLATLQEASRVFERYAGENSIGRIYVAPEDRDAADALLRGSA